MKKGLVPPDPNPGRRPVRARTRRDGWHGDAEARLRLAREQIDSLAQTLAYMKIQVSRLRSAMRDCAGAGKLMPVLDDLREGLDAGCRQVRELRPVLHSDVPSGQEK